MKCNQCEHGIDTGHALYRQNEKGVPGIWACVEHNKQPIDPLVEEITLVVEKDNNK